MKMLKEKKEEVWIKRGKEVIKILCIERIYKYKHIPDNYDM